MASRKAKVTQTDLKRYLSAYKEVGIPVGRTEIGPDGTVVIYSSDNVPATIVNDWDTN